jgi:hypothetical protein
VRVCFTAYCHTDADCTAKPGGACRVIGNNPCCSLPAPDGLGCVYPGGCATDSECDAGACKLDTATGTGKCGGTHGPCPG